MLMEDDETMLISAEAIKWVNMKLLLMIFSCLYVKE